MRIAKSLTQVSLPEKKRDKGTLRANARFGDGYDDSCNVSAQRNAYQPGPFVIQVFFLIFLLSITIGSSDVLAEAEIGSNQQAPAISNQFLNSFFDRARTLYVNCDRGQTITRALRFALPGDTIVVRGTCRERVMIATDGLALDGQGLAMIEGERDECDLGPFNEIAEGQLEIDAVQGVTISGITIRNSPFDGIFVRNGGAATLRGVTVENSCDDGIHVEQSSVVLEASAFRNNGEQGMNLFNNSAATIAAGTVAFNNNGFFGIQNQASVASVDSGAFLEANGNEFIGVATFASGRLIAFTGSHVTASENASSGMLFLDAGLTSSFATLTVTGNGRGVPDDSGITLVDSSVFSTTGSTLRINDNLAIGLVVENSTVAFRRSDDDMITIADNISPNLPFNIDVLLGFGSRGTLLGTIGTIICDDTAIIQGKTCTPLPAQQTMTPLGVPQMSP